MQLSLTMQITKQRYLSKLQSTIKNTDIGYQEPHATVPQINTNMNCTIKQFSL